MVVVKQRSRYVCALAVLVVCLSAVVSVADQNADMEKAQALFSAKDYKAAIPAYAALIEAYPSAPEVAEWHYKISSCYFSLKNFDQCFVAHNKAIELTTDSARKQGLKYERALRYESFGRLDTAIKLLDDLIREAPDAPGVYYWYFRLGYLYQQNGDHKSAKTVFQYLVDHDPKADWAYKHLAMALIKENKRIEALAVLEQCCKKEDADRAMCLFMKAEVLFMNLKDYGAVVPVIEEYLAKYPTHKFAKEMREAFLVSALKKTGRADEAVDVLKALIKPDDTVEQKATVTNRIGTVYYDSKRYREALIAFKEVRSLEVSSQMDVYAIYHSGLCYAKLGYKDSAKHCMTKVVESYPDSQWAKQANGAMYVWSTYGWDANK